MLIIVANNKIDLKKVSNVGAMESVDDVLSFEITLDFKDKSKIVLGEFNSANLKKYNAFVDFYNDIAEQKKKKFLTK